MGISRRDFLGTTALGGVAANAALGAGGTMPTRILGRTGARVSILAMGGGSRFLAHPADKATEVVHKVLDLGVTYIDTSDDYGNGESERRLGQALKGRRRGVFLATKISKRGGDDAQRILETSLKNLQTDQVDLVHIHGLSDMKDLEACEAKDGVIARLQKMRDQKLTRFIGITCHADPVALKAALERHDFDCTQMALNAAQVAMNGSTPWTKAGQSFQDLALPVAMRKKMGVIAMKVYAQEKIVGEAPLEKLMYYPLSLPGVHVAVVGMPKPEHIDENIKLAKAFKPLSSAEMKQLSGSLSDKHKLALDLYFRDHVDA